MKKRGPRKTLEQVLSEKIRYRDGHHIWIGAGKPGMPQVRIPSSGLRKNPRRVLWELAHGVSLDGVYGVVPVCDERACVRLEHLALAETAADAAALMGRIVPLATVAVRNGIPRHLFHQRVKRLGWDPIVAATQPARPRSISTAQAREIRQLYRGGGITYRDLAERYGLSQTQIGNIINYRSFADIE